MLLGIETHDSPNHYRIFSPYPGWRLSLCILGIQFQALGVPSPFPWSRNRLFVHPKMLCWLHEDVLQSDLGPPVPGQAFHGLAHTLRTAARTKIRTVPPQSSAWDIRARVAQPRPAEQDLPWSSAEFTYTQGVVY